MASTPAAQTSPGAASLMRERYGARPTRRRPLRVAAIVCAVVAAIGFGYVSWGMLQPTAEAEVSRYEVVDAGEVTLILEVTRPVGRTAVCTVEALGGGFSQVGLLEVTIEPADTAVSQIPVTIATSERATVATTRSCRLL